MIRRIAWLVVLTIVAAASSAAAKTYRVDWVAIDARVQPDGSLAIDETISYTFDGSFHFAYRDIPLANGQTVTDVEVAGNGTAYRKANNESPGSYRIEHRAGGTRITWFYAAQNEQRTFRVSYVFHGAVARYSDVAELYYQFVGDGWDRPIGSVKVTITPPGAMSSADVKAWAHGPLHGRVDIGAGGIVTLTASPLPARTFWEGRVLYPPRSLPQLPQSGGGPRLASIMAEEKEWADRSNRLREEAMARRELRRAEAERRARLAKQLLPFSIILGVLAIGIWYRFYSRYGRAYPVASRSAPGDVPSDHPPAILSYLLYGRRVSGSALVATLLDLSDRGYIEIRETMRERRGFFGGRRSAKDYRFELTGKPLGDLEPFEYNLVDFLTVEAGDGKGFTMSELKKTASRNRSKFRRWFVEWTKLVKNAGKSTNFYEPYAVRPMIWNAIVGFIVFVSGLLMTLATQSAVGAPAIVLGLVAAILTGNLNRHTPDGRRLYLAWRNFKKHLRSIERGLGPVRLESNQWGRYLGAAVIFGMYKKLLPRLEMINEKGQAVLPVWYHGGVFASGDSMASLADGLSAMVTSVSTTMSSASGAGGGASVGGGGGAGGGGGGAG